MTWMDVRDALKAGKTTAIIPTGGIEPNGPWLVLGKHNYVLRTNCDVIARKLGNALCAPIVELVPEGRIEPKSGHMISPGTISLREETFQARAHRHRAQPEAARLQEHHLHRRQRREPERPEGRGREANGAVGRRRPSSPPSPSTTPRRPERPTSCVSSGSSRTACRTTACTTARASR